MVTDDEILLTLQKMIDRAEDPKIQKHFVNYSKSLLMSFDDLGKDVAIIFENGKGTVEMRTIEEPNMTIKTDSKTIIDILAGNLSAMRAFMSGKIKAEGPAKDLMKLQRLLKT
ncbi:MAG: SCP2 sterol-binding domain-containing protein [Candidatus Odinarchaeota archaeon]|nr:SCP2 sterol-binding domain-containing protein [Candidatus Thorarchaeota archaeon]